MSAASDQTPSEEGLVHLPSPSQAAAGVATSAAGNILAGLPIPWPVKAGLIAVPIGLIFWRWIRRRKG